jgi:hypothetical protein
MRPIAVCFAVVLAAVSPEALAEGVNSNSALSVGEGDVVLRGQVRFFRLLGRAGDDIDADRFTIVSTLGWAVHDRLTLVGVLPVIAQSGTLRPPDPAPVVDLDEIGFADGRLFGKLLVADTSNLQLNLLAGLEWPSYDDPFSSDSFDPQLGAVLTLQSRDRSFDVDATWTFATGDLTEGDDSIAYNAAYTHTLVTARDLDGSRWQARAAVEVNGLSTTGDAHLIFLSPGLLVLLSTLSIELSVQLPFLRDLRGAPEPGTTVVLGAKRIW